MFCSSYASATPVGGATNQEVGDHPAQTSLQSAGRKKPKTAEAGPLLAQDADASSAPGTSPPWLRVL